MKTRHAVLALVALAAVTLTAVAAAGPEAATQRVTFTTQAARTTTVSPEVFAPLQDGPLKPDSGTLTGHSAGPRTVMRDGQQIDIYGGLTTFKGKLGTLVTRDRAEWIDAGNGYHVATSTWKVVRGTGQYAGVTGGGRGGSVWNERNDHWSSHDEGTLSLP